MRYYLIAGETSGDLHGSLLIKALKRIDKEAEFRFCGGDQMKEASGVSPDIHSHELTVMGFWEVLKRLATIRRQMKRVKNELLKYKPDRLILIDFPGFNMRVAKFAHQHKLAVHYYISPKVWAWNTKRALKIKKYVNHLYSILPFEQEFYRQFDYEPHYVGNPLLDAISEHHMDQEWLSVQGGEPILALLPGSRDQEIRNMLPDMLEAGTFFKGYKLMVAATSDFDDAYYEAICKGRARIVRSHTYELLSVAKVAMVTSGTATLETALLGCPQMVCYKTSSLSYWLGKRLIRVPYISLVNLISGKLVVKELIQEKMSPHYLIRELNRLLKEPQARNQMLADYAQVRQLLGEPGAPERAADLIVKNHV